MNLDVSCNAQAILLLTAPLIIGRGESSPELLTPVEYRKLAGFLWERRREPGDLLGSEGDALIAECLALFEGGRLERLLARGFQLSQAVERWRARAIWVTTRADEDYPGRLKVRLKDAAPPVVYGCGSHELLERGGLAVVGSRDIDGELAAYTRAIARLAATAGHTLISGGARGIDQAAMRGALEAGGSVVGVLADGLERAVLNREHRDLLMEQRLVLISPYDPAAGFNVGNAMQRNKLIYALASAALVVNADYEKGGTWAGAVEQLEKLKLIPVYIRSTGELGRGIKALQSKGALPWPDPRSAEEFDAALAVEARNVESPEQIRLPLDLPG